MLKQEDIQRCLLDAGIQKGDHLLVHSSLSKVGEIHGGGETLIDAILNVIGDAGTLVMPTFNYTTKIPQPHFDPQSTPGNTGILSELFRKKRGCLRSFSPTHSVAAMGGNASQIISGHLAQDSLGIGSPIDKVAHMGGIVLLIGVTQMSNSTIHVGEAYAKVKKFFYKAGDLPIAKVLMPDGSILEKQVDCSGSCGRAFNAVEMALRSKGLINDFDIGNAAVFMMNGMEIINSVVDIVSQRPDILFCRRPTCRRCVLGREYALYGRTVSIL